MNVETAELVVALALELNRAESLATQMRDDDDAADAGEDLVLQLAAERIVERVFQATDVLPKELGEKYYGEEPLQFLRGMRNRLAHNYSAIDHQIVRETIQRDLALVRASMARDLARAKRVLAVPNLVSTRLLFTGASPLECVVANAFDALLAEGGSGRWASGLTPGDTVRFGITITSRSEK